MAKKSPPTLADVIRSVEQKNIHAQPRSSTPSAEQVARYNQFSGHPMSNHMQADGTIVPRPLGDGK